MKSSNSQYILETLDSFLEKPLSCKLHLLGGAALELIYSIPRFSEDVDILCAMSESKYWKERNLSKDCIIDLFDRVIVPNLWKDAWYEGLKKWDLWIPNLKFTDR